MRAFQTVFGCILTTFLCSAALAGVSPANVANCGIKFIRSGEAWTVRATAPAGFHFNKKAPTQLQIPAKTLIFKPSRMDRTVADFSVPLSETQKKDTRWEARLYICDDSERICIPQQVEFTWDGKSVFLGVVAMKPAVNEAEPGRKAGDLFIGDTKTAFSKAGREHKPLLIVFTTNWCPYCNQLEEEFFPSPEFRSAARDFVLLRMDGDSQASWELTVRYAVSGYPIIILATPSGDEISRFEGTAPARLLRLMRKALDRKDVGFTELKRTADAGNAEAAQAVGEALFDHGEFTDAERYLSQAAAHYGLRSSAAESLLRTQIAALDGAEGKDALGRKTRLLEKAVADFPKSPQRMNEHVRLANIYQSTNDPSKRAQHLRAAVQAATELLADEAGRDAIDETIERLWLVIGRARAGLGDPKGKNEAYRKAIEEVNARISRLSAANPARGLHLVLAQLLEAIGETAKAQEIYRQYEARYPDEATFFLAEAEMLYDLKRLPEAEVKAKEALEKSYGDNRLSAAATLAEITASMGRKSDAVKVIDETLKYFRVQLQTKPLMDPEKVRTGRSVKRLNELKKRIQSGSFADV